MADVVKHSSLRLIDIWRFTLGQLKGEDSEGPNVHFEVVGALSSDQFWGHPAHGPDLTLPHILIGSQLDSVSEICKLDVALFRH